MTCWDAFWSNDIEQLDAMFESNECSIYMYGMSMLDFAIIEDNLHKVDYLIRRGLDINRKNDTGRNPVMLAVLGDNVPIVKALVDANACLECRDHQGNTALMNSLLVGNSVEIATLLLERGADVMVTNNEGRTLGDTWKRW
jgi:ankyrin repeat protein